MRITRYVCKRCKRITNSSNRDVLLLGICYKCRPHSCPACKFGKVFGKRMFSVWIVPNPHMTDKPFFCKRCKFRFGFRKGLKFKSKTKRIKEDERG